MGVIKRLIVAMAAFAAAASAGTLPTVTFTLDPASGFLVGDAGASVGWGYAITSTSNGSPAFVFVQSFSFGDATPIGTFSQPGVPFTAATDGVPIAAPWLLNTSGLQYDIDAAALVGASTQGVMTLTYDVYSDAAQNNPIEFGLNVNAQLNGQDVNAEVLVNSPESTVPEPSTTALFLLGAAALLFRGWNLSRPARFHARGCCESWRWSAARAGVCEALTPAGPAPGSAA